MDLTFFYQDPLLYILILAFFGGITLFLFLQYAHPAFGKKDRNLSLDDGAPGVSIVLCVRNEYENLVRLLPALLEQEYKSFEIVVVDKNSEDDTEVLLASLEHFHKNLTIRTLSANAKFGRDDLMALGVGIRAATYPYVIFFRPDCLPSSRTWLVSLVKTARGKKADTVLGYTSFKGSILLIRHDMMEQQMHQMGTTRKKIPYVSWGNNILFPKERFLSGKEFKTSTTAWNQSEQAIVSHILEKDSTIACLNPGGRVIMNRRLPAGEYHMNRVNGLCTMALTKSRGYWLLTGEKMFVAAFYVSQGLAFARIGKHGDSLLMLIPGGLLLLRWVTLWIRHAGYGSHFNDKGLAYTAPLWDLLSPVVHFYYLAAALIKRLKN
ncbi:MAG: glycosyltransferase [Bacteroidales bacterium]|nr:glycosyltransferase [Bacteroidales bacterium]